MPVSDVCEAIAVNAEAVGAVRALMPPGDDVLALAETFKVLSDPTRVRLVLALAERELCVCDLAALLGISQSAVSHQLRVLRHHRLVKYRREGKMAYYSLDDAHIEGLIAQATEHIAE